VTRLASTTTNWNYTGSAYGRLSVLMPDEWIRNYVDAMRNNTVHSPEDFLKMFPGLYLKSTFGSGSMIFVDNTAADAYTQIVIKYRTKEQGKSYTGGDSIMTRYAFWAVTKEIIQLNSYKNTNMDYLFTNDSTTYIKSPSGVFTELTVPIPEIIRKIGKRQFSSVKLSLKAYPKNEWNYSLGFPGLGHIASQYTASKLLLIQPDSIKDFFEQQLVADNATSYTTTFTSSTYTYDFNNISNLIRHAIDNKPDENLKLRLIPVQTNNTIDDNGVYHDYTTTYDLYPLGVALKSNDQKISIIASDLEINK
jgi:hypothetical protein